MTEPAAAGDLGTWSRAAVETLRTGVDADVPCGECTACCRSSFFVHIEPDEVDTLAHVPDELLFPAPGAPAGHVLLGYDEQGRCPMLGDRGCSIYDHRPRTCRRFDCRVFTATGLDPDEDGKHEIAVQVRRWRFALGPGDEVVQRAMAAAVAFLREHPEVCPGPCRPRSTRDLAAMAIRVHELFLRDDRQALRTPASSEVAGALGR